MTSWVFPLRISAWVVSSPLRFRRSIYSFLKAAPQVAQSTRTASTSARERVAMFFSHVLQGEIPLPGQDRGDPAAILGRGHLDLQTRASSGH